MSRLATWVYYNNHRKVKPEELHEAIFVIVLVFALDYEK